MTDEFMLSHSPIKDEILLHLDLWRQGQRGCAAKSVIIPYTHLRVPCGNRNIWKYTIMNGLSFSLCTIMHSNHDIHTLIHLKAEGWLSVPSCQQARLNVSQNVRLWEMAAHHVSIYRDTLTGVIPPEQSLVLEALTVPGVQKCASAYPFHQWDE